MPVNPSSLGRRTGFVRRLARWRRVAQHLLHRATVDAKPPARLVMTQTLVDNRQSNRRIELHAVHLLPLVATDKGP